MGRKTKNKIERVRSPKSYVLLHCWPPFVVLSVQPVPGVLSYTVNSARVGRTNRYTCIHTPYIRRNPPPHSWKMKKKTGLLRPNYVIMHRFREKPRSKRWHFATHVCFIVIVPLSCLAVTRRLVIWSFSTKKNTGRRRRPRPLKTTALHNMFLPRFCRTTMIDFQLKFHPEMPT